VIAALVLLALGACLALALWVFSSAGADYAARHAAMQRWLVVPTFVYFAASTQLALARSRR
jgi:hypothetical protein